jgi:3-oxoacyl-[acyl-carrier protein] reductase
MNALPVERPQALRHAFVTGAARGLGLAIARGVAAAGYTVMLADIDGVGAVQAAEALRQQGFDAISVALDVRDEAGFAAGFEQAVARWGHIDLMVNNAARGGSASLWDVDAAEWDDVLAVNLRGCFFGCRIAGRHMRERGAGRIVNLSSIAGQQVSAASGTHYAASKAGILALTRSFAAELAPHGVCVNALAPSAIEGPALQGIDEDRRRALLGATPLGRFGHADDVAAAVVYLAGDGAGFITGTTLDLNGGRSMR